MKCFVYILVVASIAQGNAQQACSCDISSGSTVKTCPSQVRLIDSATNQLMADILSTLSKFFLPKQTPADCSCIPNQAIPTKPESCTPTQPITPPVIPPTEPAPTQPTTPVPTQPTTPAPTQPTTPAPTQPAVIQSCNDLPPNSPNGFYTVIPPTSQSPVTVYCSTDIKCDCAGGKGAWRRVAYLDMTDPTQQCPNSWHMQTSPSGIRTCSKGSVSTNNCVSAYFQTDGIPYSRVCGRVVAYQYGAVDAFDLGNNPSIEVSYLDGLSLTYGPAGSRKHVWSFVISAGEGVGGNHRPKWMCKCSTPNWPFSTPSFVGENYFCDTGCHEGSWVNDVAYYDDPLWDGQGCQRGSTCCSFNNPPQFCTTLPQPTTQDLELRNCDFGTQDDNTLVSHVYHIF